MGKTVDRTFEMVSFQAIFNNVVIFLIAKMAIFDDPDNYKRNNLF
jgi:hypothetical protein